MAKKKNWVSEWEVQRKMQKLLFELKEKPIALEQVIKQSKNATVISIIQAHSPSCKRFERIKKQYLRIFKRTLEKTITVLARPDLLKGKEISEKLRQNIKQEAKQNFVVWLKQEFGSLLEIAQRAKQLREFIQKHEQETGSKLLTTQEAAEKLSLKGVNVIRKYGWTGKVRSFVYKKNGHISYYFCEKDVENIVRLEQRTIARRKKFLDTWRKKNRSSPR